MGGNFLSFWRSVLPRFRWAGSSAENVLFSSAARTVNAIFAKYLLHKCISSCHCDADFFKPFIVSIEGKVPYAKFKAKM